MKQTLMAVKHQQHLFLFTLIMIDWQIINIYLKYYVNTTVRFFLSETMVNLWSFQTLF